MIAAMPELPRLRVHDPGLAALRSAVRAAIVIPSVFAFADKVIDNPQTSFLAAFGSFAVLVFVEFTGPPRTRLLAYLCLGCVGALYITLGTLCSRSALLATGIMAIVGFVTLFSGTINGYFAAGATGAILLFVLPVTIRAPNSAIPDRLVGWGLAIGVGTCAVMLLWPSRRSTDLQRASADTLRDVADVADPDAPAPLAERVGAARASINGLARRMLGAQHRPTGPTNAQAALAGLPDELDWLLLFIAPLDGQEPLDLACPEDGAAMSEVAAVLRACADRLEGAEVEPDLARLDAAKKAVVKALLSRVPDLVPAADDGALPESLESPFRIRVAIYSTQSIAERLLVATGEEKRKHSDLDEVEGAVVEHLDVSDVWFRNSLRGAVGLAVAVFIAERLQLQHAFWVVLGTLSVLRSNALGTGWSILSALAGTAVGLVIGALLVIGIGTHEGVLWAVLPFAVLIAAYAPRAVSFAAGQAGFTVTLFVLFNLIAPVGWSVGVVRIEDVAIGFAISLGVGLLFWPRGAASLLRRDLATAYARAADAVVATTARLVEGGSAQDAERAERQASIAEHRLDDAFRQYLTERSATPYNMEDIAALVAGVSRLRRAEESLASLATMVDGDTAPARCGENLDGELHALQAWYVSLGYAIENRHAPPPPHIRDVQGRHRLLACVREEAARDDMASRHAALVLLWASQHLDNLWRLEGHLGERAEIAQADAVPV
jgi:uncharacterized membrane protein YccC